MESVKADFGFPTGYRSVILGAPRGASAVSTSPGPSRRRWIEVEDVGEASAVRFKEARLVEEEPIQTIGEHLFCLVDELGRRRLLVSFEGVEFAATALLGKLITLHRKLQAVGGQLTICGLNKDLSEIFRITKLDRFLTVANHPGLTTTAAVAAELFGPPAPVPFAPDWKTDTVLLLAKRIRDGAEYTTMPILADALQDAGCESAAILDHLRGPGPHVRECWVLDLILGPVAE
jgi:anti-sigma B factor antagonist